MIHDALEMKWQISRGEISRWWNKRSNEQDFKVESRRERLIKVLQKRYGYSKEKAASELDTTYSKARLS
jgi:hypothetical protein